MPLSPALEFPPQQDQALRKARRLERLTIAYLASVVVVMFFSMGASQAMKTAWMEDMLGFIPPLVFLIATRIAIWPPNKRFPYGYHRVISIAFLCASLALFTMGAWLLVDAVYKLIVAEHPTIGGVQIFGRTIWLGWLMIPALLYSSLPSMWLGRAKLPLAKTMHDKVLFADAAMNRADWQTALAAIAGIVGVGFGFWWADAAAAGLISFSVLYDGYRNLREVITNLMDEAPKKVGEDNTDPLPQQLESLLLSRDWIVAASVRMREQGHVYFGEALIVVAPNFVGDLPQSLSELTDEATRYDWRIHDLVIAPVPQLPEEA
ncbi:cation diffusion facilitator family transporter [Blastopirellula marina]|nr:cation diffusion facilitator family transporter [Blastopirellula marina]